MAADESTEQYLVEPLLVADYLSTNPSVPPAFRNPKDIQKLSGGSGNFVFRLQLTPGDDTAGFPETVVLKHSAPFVASWPAMAFDIDRWEVERAALPVSDKTESAAKPCLLQELKTAHIKIPTLYFSDPEKKVLIIEDAGESAVSLKQLLAREQPLSEKLMLEIGKELGEWLALLHTTTSTTTDGKMEITQEFRDSFESTTARNMCAWRTFGRLKESIAVWDPKYEYNDHNAGEKGGSEEELEMIAAKVHQEIMRDSHCVTMGDFWTGNVLIRLKREDELDTAYIVDWELAHPGDPATDVAQMTAEMFCSYTFANPENATAAKALAQKFHESYCEAAKSAETQSGLRGRVMLHAGAHVALWVGLVGWTEDVEKITEARNAGMDMLWEGSKGGGEGGNFCAGLTN